MALPGRTVVDFDAHAQAAYVAAAAARLGVPPETVVIRGVQTGSLVVQVLVCIEFCVLVSFHTSHLLYSFRIQLQITRV
jgi:hypothetical protein